MIRLVKASRSYGIPPVIALDSISLDIGHGEFVAITGQSGSGKSTLLNLLGGLDHPTSGQVVVDGIHLESANDHELTLFRRKKLGMVFQFFNLLPAMTLVENVEMPLLLRGEHGKSVRTEALAMLDQVGMEHRAGHFPHQLSGGEMQRGAIARALIHTPSLLLADEPTGNLDSTNASQVLEVIAKIASRRTTTVIMVTHSDAVAALADRRIQIKDGIIASDSTRTH
ncbi:MAG: ABC transporter ATP-binding protein [Verrucomicrobia bacterium]|nr:MAG: ABC transporter ATP-binding protein [Verrucomicrobiota bacterium]